MLLSLEMSVELLFWLSIPYSAQVCVPSILSETYHHPELRRREWGLGASKGRRTTTGRREERKCLVNDRLPCFADKSFWYKSLALGASPDALMVTNLLPVQRTQVQLLVQEDPTRHGASKLAATTTELSRLRTWEPQLLSPCHKLKPVPHNKKSH